jgi:hypothetical protein
MAPRILPRCGVPVDCMPVRIRDIRGIVEAKIESILITDYGLRITDFSFEISALFRVD